MDSSEDDNNNPAALDGLSLKEALDKHVFCDPETETIRPGVEGAPRWRACWHLTVDGKARARAYYTPPAPRIRVRKMVIKGRETGRLRQSQPS
ncbi:MAG: hypothetical protein GXP05_06035, partial [Alphaproteobacteria bacterium]|nr:hypothetical protein [Alphaproteobacteria bacterium]